MSRRTCGACKIHDYTEEEWKQDEIDWKLKHPQHATLYPDQKTVAPSHPAVLPTVEVKVFSAYLGEVDLLCQQVDADHVSMMAVLDPVNEKSSSVVVKAMDAAICRMSTRRLENEGYTLRQLVKMPASVVSLSKCKANAEIIAQLSLRKKNGDTLSQAEETSLYDCYVYNSAVDVHFNTVLFLRFVREKFGINNVIPSDVLFSIHNVIDYDNAFFSGKYMVYGNGSRRQKNFYAFSTLDTTGHELGHALNSVRKLVYLGVSGALDEGYADIHGAMLELYAYTLYPHLLGQPDWLQGEDNGNWVKILRNMQDPSLSDPPQPKAFHDRNYANPNQRVDNGNVHQNCSLPNYLFYLHTLSKLQMDPGTNVTSQMAVTPEFLNAISDAYSEFTKAFQKLKPVSSWLTWRDALKSVNPEITPSLNAIGLTDTAVNDWNLAK